ncbi:SagB/ThcOx family dehydrogenase [Brevibacterium sandarakinum]|uniref:SagB/ThcOx family dehydrogenase n=1 Tax=Brevibacterium sandarakinum TaxID=629680 RepID=UPI0012FE7283|nr:SagB/ThcOx family dehydrogenase [Brevibacterium sandarakinum]
MSRDSDCDPVNGKHDNELRIVLNPPQDDRPFAKLLRHRGSTKSYRPAHIDLETLSRLLGAAIGCASTDQRPYGSAHARYGIVVTVIAAAVDGLAPAASRYLPVEHALVQREEGDHRALLARGSLDADWLTTCPAMLLLSADLAAANDSFATQEAGRGERYCWFEAGLIAQNVYLWAAENALGTVFLGGLDSVKIQAAARLVPPSHTILGIHPLGHPAEGATSEF